MPKNIHEIRDPIHNFIRLDSYEREVLDSASFQRLRHIHQLGLTYLLYPSVTHKRFEHSLGVMELATRVFKTITDSDAVSDNIKELIPEITRTTEKDYWLRVLRMAALCHDLGHLPFSHSAEQLLPNGYSHELITRDIILSDQMKAIWNSITPPLRPKDIVKLAIGPEKAQGMKYSNWEAILSEIIVGDAFGVDRMDYLLRDSYHAGVAYGKFDHYRLIDTLRILAYSDQDSSSSEPNLGIEEGGLHSAEALLLARYFMYSQMYIHPIRRIYDLHLRDFFGEWLNKGKFSIDPEEHYALTDNEILTAIAKASFDKSAPGYLPASIIVNRNHFKDFYQRNANDIKINPSSGENIYDAAIEQFGDENIRYDKYSQKESILDFPVKTRDDSVEHSTMISETLNKIPLLAIEFVFIKPSLKTEARDWLKKHKAQIIQHKPEEKE